MSDRDEPTSEEKSNAKLQPLTQYEKWQKLKIYIERYKVMRAELIEEMENQTDPVFLRYLNLYKSTMTPEEFERKRFNIYATCNKHAMYACVPVDEVIRNLEKPHRRRH